MRKSSIYDIISEKILDFILKEEDLDWKAGE
jgi:hypothetical protein